MVTVLTRAEIIKGVGRVELQGVSRMPGRRGQ
jgi:hypothetical protein